MDIGYLIVLVAKEERVEVTHHEIIAAGQLYGNIRARAVCLDTHQYPALDLRAKHIEHGQRLLVYHTALTDIVERIFNILGKKLRRELNSHIILRRPEKVDSVLVELHH